MHDPKPYLFSLYRNIKKFLEVCATEDISY